MRVTKWSAALLCGMALALPVGAQEDAIPKEPPPATEPQEPAAEPAPAPAPPARKQANVADPPLHRWGGITLSVAAWQPALIGADEELAWTFPGGVGTPLMAGSTTRTRETAVGIYHLPKDLGSIGASYDSMDHDDSFSYVTPGQFGFFESRAFPAFRGAFDDGMADAVTADIVRKTREFRLWYSQTAFETPRAKGTWGVGYRQVSHSRNVAINYLAVVPNLPPVIPPVLPPGVDPGNLQPFPDGVSQTANFDGHGLGVSLDLQFPVHRRVSIISGLSIGLIRGSASSSYRSFTSYYYSDFLPDVLTKEELFYYLTYGPPEFIASIHQGYYGVGQDQPETSQFAETFDIYLGLEVTLYPGLKIFGTLRELYYANVGEYVVPQVYGAEERTLLSAGYEGYVLGLSWRF
jgi:hypothetical protein